MTTETATPDDTATRAKLSPTDEVRALLDRLPDTVTLEDIQYHLDVVVKVLEAEASLDSGEGIPHEEVFRRLQEKWPETDGGQNDGFTEEDCNRRFGSGSSNSKTSV